MYSSLIPTLEALGVETSPENVEILRRAFNRIKADDIAYQVREFTPEGASPRYFAQGAAGNSIVIVADEMPKIGDLVHTGGVSYYVESHFSAPEEIANSVAPAGAKQTNRR